MKNALIAVLTAVIIVGNAAAPARADAPSPSALTLKVGGGVQSSAAQSFIFAAGADYALHPATTLSPVTVSLYLDVLGKSAGGGLAIRNPGDTYIGAGVGYYSVSLTPAQGGGCVPGFPCPVTTYTANGLGGKIFAGFGAHGLSFELGYHYMPKAGGYQTNAATAELAFHL